MEIATSRNRVMARSRTARAERLKGSSLFSTLHGHACRGLLLRESYGLAFAQQMRPERHDAIAGLEFADDRRRFVAEGGHVHRTPGDPRRLPFDQPYAGPLPGSKIAPIGTCSAGADRPSAIWMEMVEPSGASARRPSST